MVPKEQVLSDAFDVKTLLSKFTFQTDWVSSPDLGEENSSIIYPSKEDQSVDFL